MAGLFSSMASIALYSFGPYSWVFPGFLFGLFISGALAAFGMLTTIPRAIGVMIITTMAYPSSILLAGGVQLVLPWWHWSMGDRSGISSVSLFAGGFIGALLVIPATLALLPSRTEKGFLLTRSVWLSLLGGVLAIIGWKLGSSLGMRLWYVAHAFRLTAPDEGAMNAAGDTSHQFSLWVIWQTGMAVVLGLAVRRLGEPKEVKQP